MSHSHAVLRSTICRKDKITTQPHPNDASGFLPESDLATLVTPPLGGVYVSEIWCNCRRHSAFLTVKSVLHLRLQTGVR